MGDALNPILYTALRQEFGEVEISSRGSVGAYSCPSGKGIGISKLSKAHAYAKVEDWGETYHVNCPFCNDRKKRLYISYFTGLTVHRKQAVDPLTQLLKPGSPVSLGTIAVCHNEHCNVRDLLRTLLASAGSMATVQIQPSTVAYKGAKIVDVELPPNYPLLGNNVPKKVLDYLAERRYDPVYLATQFDIRFVPAGTVMWLREDGKPVKTYENRILIPISKGRRIIGWQARIAERSDNPKARKYIFPPTRLTGGVGKSTWLYNASEASYRSDLVLVEGVTDAWRVGEQAVALFGKACTLDQMKIIDRVWSYHATCVVLLDGDAQAEARALVAKFREMKAFPKGIDFVPLPTGYDPDSYTTEEINAIIDEARKCLIS
jgi:hypothetical protein